MKSIATLFLVFISFLMVNGQMKAMDQSVYAEWNTLTSQGISNDGKWIKYHLTPGKGDKTLVLYHTGNQKEMLFNRVKNSQFTADNEFAIFTVGASVDTITAMKRRKVDKKKMPKDTLIIYDLNQGLMDTVPNLGTFKIPSKWSDVIAFQANIMVSDQDTSKKTKDEQRFFIHDFKTGARDTFANVEGYSFAGESRYLTFHRNGKDSSDTPGVYLYDVDKKEAFEIFSQRGEFKNVAINSTGQAVSFVADLDTTSRRLRPYELLLWQGRDCVTLVEANESLDNSPNIVTANTKPSFSEGGSILYFGLGEPPVLADSLALDEELVQVEVWTTEDPMLYTMQELREDALKKETYQVRYDLNTKKFTPLESEERGGLRKSMKGDGDYYLISNTKPYSKALTWSGRLSGDLYLFDGQSGKEKMIAKELTGNANFSPSGKYVYWFDREELDWFVYDIEKESTRNLSEDFSVSVVNELNDVPAKPREYGSGGWLPEDKGFIIYDRFDIWKLDPEGATSPQMLTDGRKDQLQHRLIDLDPEEDAISTQPLVYLFSEKTKESGYGRLNLSSGQVEEIVLEPYSFRRRPMKAKNSDDIVYSKESFEKFPDLIHTTLAFENPTTISKANPQQNDYRWGSIELFTWNDFDGKEVEGLLVKPEGFDPSRKYPIIVNFYERSSNSFHRHRAPEPHRSTINYSYYANKGYVIFNPDVSYKIGDPGESAYNAVVSGVEALSKNQWVDKDRIGVQGHSWGGYQIAHLLNKTNIFRCAESGAPVVNMVSAYGGIRWGSGMSRMFQYEKTQSRLGKTLWEDPDAYLRNSPIFEMDNMNTPVLILHNDNDGAVPWYQGIEYFMALRRLGKPAWFLNYNGEPHWPLKWQNRLDFNMRMEQFFAHFLLDQPMPLWMKEGVNVVNKGINQGFEIEE